jgi:hypothetical protein
LWKNVLAGWLWFEFGSKVVYLELVLVFMKIYQLWFPFRLLTGSLRLLTGSHFALDIRPTNLAKQIIENGIGRA